MRGQATIAADGASIDLPDVYRLSRAMAMAGGALSLVLAGGLLLCMTYGKSPLEIIGGVEVSPSANTLLWMAWLLGSLGILCMGGALWTMLLHLRCKRGLRKLVAQGDYLHWQIAGQRKREHWGVRVVLFLAGEALAFGAGWYAVEGQMGHYPRMAHIRVGIAVALVALVMQIAYYFFLRLFPINKLSVWLGKNSLCCAGDYLTWGTDQRQLQRMEVMHEGPPMLCLTIRLYAGIWDTIVVVFTTVIVVLLIPILPPAGKIAQRLLQRKYQIWQIPLPPGRDQEMAGMIQQFFSAGTGERIELSVSSVT